MFKCGIGAGTPLYLAKMEYAFGVLSVKEWWPTFESYYGFRRGAIIPAAFQKPYPEYQHELGGARVFYNTREQWKTYIKPTYRDLLGERSVPKELLEKLEILKNQMLRKSLVSGLGNSNSLLQQILLCFTFLQ